MSWFRVTTNNLRDESVHIKKSEKHMVMLHTLANFAVGFFATQLRWALANGAETLGPSKVGLVPPPIASTLPFNSFLVPPVPFEPESLSRFSRSHISAMTDPSFYVEDEWTGYCAYITESRIWFQGFGGDNPDVGYYEDLAQQDVERTIRFELVQEGEDSTYTLLSNYAGTHELAYQFQIVVDRITGHLKIAYNDLRRQLYWDIVDGVITPFGIVTCNFRGCFWLWLWKCKWSEQDRVL
jgi:hypothetical protein